MITLGKQGHQSARSRASAFLLQPSLVPKLFTTFAQRYSERPGGYTRIHKLGNRHGDNAPRAILELVDNPKDLRFEMTSKAIGFDLLRERLQSEDPVSIVNSPLEGVRKVLDEERMAALGAPQGVLRPKTRWNLQKVLRYKSKTSVENLGQKAQDHMVSCISVDHSYFMAEPDQDQLLATPLVYRSIVKENHRREEPKDNTEKKKFKEAAKWRAATPSRKAGYKLPGETRPALSLAQGALGHQKAETTRTVLSEKTVFRRLYNGS
jgi:large subunit ribosomal protein L17